MAKAELARRRLLNYCQFVDPSFDIAPHHVLIASKLEAVERGEIKRLIIQVPPRHGKSELCSRNFPSWYLGRNPDHNFIIASYASSLSKTFSRRNRDTMESKRFSYIFPNVKVQQFARSVNDWNIAGRHGGMISAGVCGGLTGHGANCFLIDDPVKNMQEADSKVYQDNIFEWFQSVALTRLEPNASIIIIMTRWNQMDLAGRIIKEMPGQWEVINIPAVTETEADVKNDPLHRGLNEAIWAQRYPASYFIDSEKGIKKSVGSRVWSALYQGKPMDPATQIIKREWIRWYSSLPIEYSRFGGIDTATSVKTSADNMSLIDVCRCWEGFLYVDDAFLDKLSVYSFSLHVSSQHAAKKYELIKLESNNAGEAVRQRIEEVGREQKTYPPISAEATSTDKVVRVHEFAPLIENGTIRFKLGNPRVAELVEHLIAFDGRGMICDDDVDGLGFAIKAAIGGAVLFTATDGFDVK
jgi:Uncharacterized protein conserved in bacteria